MSKEAGTRPRAADSGSVPSRASFARRLTSATLACLALSLALYAVVSGASAHRPRSAAAGPAPSRFGLDPVTADNNFQRFKREIGNAKSIGARWVEFPGGYIHSSRAKVDFSIMDSQVTSARRRGLGVLITLGGVSSACPHGGSGDVSACAPTTKRTLHAYARYLRLLLKHYKGRVSYYESWGQPNDANLSPAAYARLLQTEHAAFHAAGGSAKLLFAGIGGSDLGYLDQVLTDLDGRKLFDLVGDRPFRNPPTPPSTPNYAISFPGGTHPKLTWEQELVDYEHEFTAHGYGTPPMWLTEFGWPGTSTAGVCPGNPSESDQASSIQSAYQLLTGDPQLSFIDGAFYFNQRDYAPGSASSSSCTAHYGLESFDYSPKPALSVFEHFAGGP